MIKLNKVTIIGVGLIGGSFAKGLKEAGLVKSIMGYGIHEENLQKGIELGVLDEYSTNIQTAVTNSDLVFFAVPLGVMPSILEAIKPFVNTNTIMTDAGSVKGSVIEYVKDIFGEIPENFIPGHPIAGKEKSGIMASDTRLYIDHRVILTPTAGANIASVQLITELWQALGASVEIMDAKQHDEIFAATSHLPHLLAFSLVDLLNEHEELGSIFRYTAGGFRDFTRIASGDATMWRDIALTNADEIVTWLKNYQKKISQLTELIKSKEGEELYSFFDGAKIARDKHIVK